jgi:GTP pyrophosphokinase
MGCLAWGDVVNGVESLSQPNGSDASASTIAVTSAIVAATAASLPQQAHALSRARAFAEPLLASELLDTGENTLAHAEVF